MNGTAFLDTRSVLVVAVAMAALMGGVSFVFASVERRTRALRLWGWSLLLFALGLTLVALRAKLPEAIGSLVADTILFGAAIPMLRSVRSFNAEPGDDVTGWLLVLLGCALILYWSLLRPDQSARIAAFSAIMALQYLRVAAYLLRTLPASGRASQIFTAGVIALFAGSCALRAILTLAAEDLVDYFAPSNLQSTSLLGYLVLYLAATLGVMWMEIQRLEADLVKLATTDSLTGMLNRRMFLDATEREISRCKRSGETFGFAMFDLDHFKLINDRHGHIAGDRVLRAFADTLRGVLRPHDLLGRYGGEEFALLLPGIDRNAAAAIVERCRQAVEQRRFAHEGAAIQLTVSAGVAAFDADGNDLNALIAAADAALYQAKREGRNRVAAAAPEPPANA